MSNAPKTTQIRIEGPADLIATLPYFLGYALQDAVAVVAVTNASIAMVQRVNTPTTPQDARDAAQALLPMLVRHRLDAVVIVAYEDLTRSAALVAALTHLCDEMDIPVADSLLVRDGCWTRCGSQSKHPIVDGHPVVAPLVVAGVAPLSSRAAFAAQLDTNTDSADAVEDLLPNLGSAHRLSAAWIDLLHTTTLPRTTRLLAEAAATITTLRARDLLVAALCPGSLDPAVLDPAERAEHDLIRAALPNLDTEQGYRRVRDALTAFATAMPPALAPAAYTTLATFAWYHGDGTLASIAVDRALGADPTYRLALLLARMICEGITLPRTEV